MKDGITTDVKALAYLFGSQKLNNATGSGYRQDTSVDEHLAAKAMQRQADEEASRALIAQLQAEDGAADQATLDLIAQMQREDTAVAGPSDDMDPETAALLAQFEEEDRQANNGYRL